MSDFSLYGPRGGRPLPMCDCGWNVYDCQCRQRVRQLHALSSMRACLGVLAFAALAVNCNDGLRACLDRNADAHSWPLTRYVFWMDLASGLVTSFEDWKRRLGR